MNEYYIRQPDSEEARGPYDLSRIGDLIEAGKADVTTLYYDEDREDWIPLADNADFREVLFPEKKRLALRAKEITETLNDDENEDETISVDQMLAAAEGRTAETRHAKNPDESRGIAAGIALPVLALCMLINAFYAIYPNLDNIQGLIDEGNYLSLILAPGLLDGLAYLFFSLCCFLAATEIYPILRLFMVANLSFHAYIFWAWDEPNKLIASLVGYAGIFLLSMTTNLYVVIPLVLASLGGLGALVYMQVFV